MAHQHPAVHASFLSEITKIVMVHLVIEQHMMQNHVLFFQDLYNGISKDTLTTNITELSVDESCPLLQSS